MTHSETVGKIAAALAKAQKAIKGAAKDARNPHFNSRYADLATVVDACRDALADNEIAVFQSPKTDAQLVSLTTLLLHSSGEWIESDPLTVQVRDAGPQAVGSGLTYCRRYQLAAVVGVAPEDDDAEAAEGRNVPTAKPSASHPTTRTAASGSERETVSAPKTGGESGSHTAGEVGPCLVTKIGPGRSGAIAEITLEGHAPILAFAATVKAVAEKARAEGHTVVGTIKRSSTGNYRLEELKDTGMTVKELADTKFSAEHGAPITADQIPF